MPLVHNFLRCFSATKPLWILLVGVASATLSTTYLHATTFTYQGTLNDGGRPAEGRYDLELTLYAAAEGGRVLGGPVQLYSVPVRNGTFTTQVEFGPVANVTGNSWLEVKVRAAGSGDYVTLSARAPVSADLTTATSSVCPGAWTIAGNAGNPAGSYLGTADNEPLVFKVGGVEVGSMVPGGADALDPQSVNVVLGYNNLPVDTHELATIGGGTGNRAGTVGTIAGGLQNRTGFASNVSGGAYNKATGIYSVVPGGLDNTAGGDYSFASGHLSRVRDAQQTGTSGGDQGTFLWSDSTGFPFTSTGVDQFLVRAGGGVAINDTPPNHDVELTIAQSAADTSGQASIYMRQSSSHAGVLLASGGAAADPANDATFYIYNYNPGAPGAPAMQELSLVGGNLTIAGTATKPGGGSWSVPSDRRIKHDIVPIADAVDTLLKLQPVSFHYDADYRAAAGVRDDNVYFGFVAQDYARVYPDAVSATRERVPNAPPSEAPILTLDPNPALITTVAAVQELAVDTRAQSAELAQLRAENATLRAALDDMRARVDRIERREER